MIVNPSKHHAMVLGSTDHQFYSFTTKDSLDLPGTTIDPVNWISINKSRLFVKKSQQSAECYAVSDPDLEITGGGGRSSRPLDKGGGVGLPTIFFLVWSKNKGGRASPDPPLLW